MSDDLRTGDHHWQIIPNFDGQSRFPFSSASGLPKRDGDPGIIRAIHGYVEMEGFFDITFYDAEQLAKLLGYISKEDAQKLHDRIGELETEAELIRSKAFKDAENAVKMAGVRKAKS